MITIGEVLPSRKVTVELRFVDEDGRTVTEGHDPKIIAFSSKDQEGTAAKYKKWEFLHLIPLQKKYIFYVREH